MTCKKEDGNTLQEIPSLSLISNSFPKSIISITGAIHLKMNSKITQMFSPGSIDVLLLEVLKMFTNPKNSRLLKPEMLNASPLQSFE